MLKLWGSALKEWALLVPALIRAAPCLREHDFQPYGYGSYVRRCSRCGKRTFERG